MKSLFVKKVRCLDNVSASFADRKGNEIFSEEENRGPELARYTQSCLVFFCLSP
jgi:hypothetical protein